MVEGMVLERAGQSSAANFNNEEYDTPSNALNTEVRGDSLVISGDIDLYVAAAFREAGENHVRSCATPHIDLTGVAFLDSAGLASLLGIARAARAGNHPLRVTAIGNPRRVLRITGVDRMVQMQD